jgi:hypothetical protein
LKCPDSNPLARFNGLALCALELQVQGRVGRSLKINH